MKRKLSVLVAALLVIAMVGPAAAFFEKGHLVQVIYKDADKEVLTDLLDAKSFSWNTAGTTVLDGPGTFGTGQFPSASNGWGDLKAAFFAYHTVGSSVKDAWFATTEKTAPVISQGSTGAFMASATGIQNPLIGTDRTKEQLYANNQQAYDYIFNSKSTNSGSFGGYNVVPAVGEISLAPLAGLLPTEYLSMYLYQFDRAGSLVASPLGTPYMGELRLFADGQTEINVVPVPAAVWLLASGVVGLVAVRRRSKNESQI